jgi:FKBP-type peptidyl-prolyl cis-trans isomerase
MRIGGTRTLKISPHLGYGEKGIPGVIPSNAVLIAEIAFLEQRKPGDHVVETGI